MSYYADKLIMRKYKYKFENVMASIYYAYDSKENPCLYCTYVE